MPRQNRATPFNALVAVTGRGSLMGNRGILHDAAGRILRSHGHLHWVTCRLVFKDRQRKVMTPGRYTELFFLDEATALAAGHRPCAECRNADYKNFKGLLAETWGVPAKSLSAAEIDRRLHAERMVGRGAGRHKPTFSAAYGALPGGAMFTTTAQSSTAFLKWRDKPLRWSFGGYTPAGMLAPEKSVNVLTPRSVSATIRLGYLPAVHPSADL